MQRSLRSRGGISIAVPPSMSSHKSSVAVAPLPTHRRGGRDVDSERAMRKRLRFAILSIIAAAIAGRVSLGWPMGGASAAETLSATADAMVVAQASGQRVSSTMMRLLPGLPDAAKLFLMGG